MRSLLVLGLLTFLKAESKTVGGQCPAAVLKTVNSKYLQVRDGFCFQFSITERKTYAEANKQCKKNRGTLALPKTKSLNDFLTDQLFNHYSQYEEAWIGLHDKVDETKFVWEDGTQLKWTNFAPGNGPDNDWLVRGVEDCVALNPENDGLWYDHQCDSNLLAWATRANPSKIYICQFPLSPVPSDRDRPVDADKTRTVENTCPAGLVTDTNSHFLQVWGGFCFHFVIYRWKTYSEAIKDCLKHGGTLALPKTKSLNDFLTDKLFNHYSKYEEAWIGLHDTVNETKFVWEDGTQLKWTNFAPGNGPDNDWLVRGVEDCVALNPENDGLWYDHQCDSNLLTWATRANPSKIYICQYTPNVLG